VLDDHEFEVSGESFEKEAGVNRGDAGNAECRLMPLRGAVDGAVPVGRPKDAGEP
jgi:hypothetical protein